MTTLRHSLAAKLMRFPAAGIAYGLLAAILFGVGCGLVHAPFVAVVLIGLTVAAGSIWIERNALLASPDGSRRTNVGLQLAAAYAFVAVVAIGLVSLGYFFVNAALRH